MAPTVAIAPTPVESAETDLLAVPVFTGGDLGPGGEALDAALGGDVTSVLAETGFKAKAGEAVFVPVAGRVAAGAAVLVGLGERDRLDLAVLRRAAAGLARAARVRTDVTTVATTLAEVVPDGAEKTDAVRAVTEGLLLGAYRFTAYKSEPDGSELERIELLGRGGARLARTVERAATVCEAVAWARDVVNEPSGGKSPAAFAEMARERLEGRGVEVSILDEAGIEAERLGGVAGVGQGSARPPRFVTVTYSPPKARATLALVGKGVVFDSGGISIKPSSGMETMKTDMSGAAAVLAAMSVLDALDVKAKVVAYVPMVENMPSGSAIRPGDVLRIRNGKTVEVLNTDAEGRLILADGLARAVEDGADAIVDVATLTGACVVALGEKVAGLMGNRDPFVDQVRGAAERAGERVWHLPLPADYKALLDSSVADIQNISEGRWGGALTAGLFLEAFVDGTPWAHLDIAGPARASRDDGEHLKGGTGFGVRTLVELASSFRRPAARDRDPDRAGGRHGS